MPGIPVQGSTKIGREFASIGLTDCCNVPSLW
jgi:hypothetical protein